MKWFDGKFVMKNFWEVIEPLLLPAHSGTVRELVPHGGQTLVPGHSFTQEDARHRLKRSLRRLGCSRWLAHIQRSIQQAQMLFDQCVDDSDLLALQNQGPRQLQDIATAKSRLGDNTDARWVQQRAAALSLVYWSIRIDNSRISIAEPCQRRPFTIQAFHVLISSVDVILVARGSGGAAAV